MSLLNPPVTVPGGLPAAQPKFNREYILQISGPDLPDTIVITLPFTIELDVERDNYTSTNRGTLKIYNLSQLHRNQILHDQYDQSNKGPQVLYVTLQAGYGNGPNYPIVLKGNVIRAFSYRQGVNFITQIDVFDGGLAYVNAVSSRTFSANTTIMQITDSLINDLVSVAPFGLSKGVISTMVGKLSKGNSYSGNTIQLLTELSNSNFFIDNGVVNVLLPTDAIGGNNVVLNSTSGLLGTPIKQSQFLLVDLLFEPRISVGSIVNLDSIGVKGTRTNNYGAYYNGPHKVVGVSHRGMISAAVCGEVTTHLSLLAGEYNLIFSSANGKYITVPAA